jgi:putative NADH-flavin reductase
MLKYFSTTHLTFFTASVQRFYMRARLVCLGGAESLYYFSLYYFSSTASKASKGSTASKASKARSLSLGGAESLYSFSSTNLCARKTSVHCYNLKLLVYAAFSY